MTAAPDQKYRNFQVIRGGGVGTLPLRGRRRGRRHKTAAEMVLDRWVREEFNALVDARGKRPSEAIQKICEGVQTPLGCFGRRLVEAHSAGCTHAQVRRLWNRVGEWIDRMWEQPVTADCPTPSETGDGRTVKPEGNPLAGGRVFYQGPRLCA